MPELCSRRAALRAVSVAGGVALAGCAGRLPGQQATTTGDCETTKITATTGEYVLVSGTPARYVRTYDNYGDVFIAFLDPADCRGPRFRPGDLPDDNTVTVDGLGETTITFTADATATVTFTTPICILDRVDEANQATLCK